MPPARPNARPKTHNDSSGTPLPRKLGIREGSVIVVAGAPAGFELAPLPAGVGFRDRPRSGIDVALVFVTARPVLERRFPSLAKALAPAGRLWVAWPKKASGIDTDLSFDIVQSVGLAAGLVDNKSASIDAIYQGLQFVIRLRDRAAR